LKYFVALRTFLLPRANKIGIQAHACNPSYLRNRDEEEYDLRPAWANSSQDLISKIARAKWTGGMAQSRTPAFQA
jgi:hypothetical protein